MDLFDPNTYRAVRRPLTQAETLPTQVYTSPEFYQREIETIFMKYWNCVGREDYIKNPGEYFIRELVGTSLIIMRGNDHKCRAFLNACRHRGTKLLDQDGRCNVIQCPYHGWSYGVDGRLVAFNRMESVENLAPKDYGLVEIKLETWSGFIFVNFDPDSISLKQYLGNIGRHTDSYHFEEMVTIRRKEYVVRTNWKAYVENSIEPIHLPLVHGKTIGHVFGSTNAQWELIDGRPGNFVIQHTITDRSRAVLHNDRGFANLPNLTGTAAEGAQYVLIHPCTVIGGDLDIMWFKQMQPDGPHMVRNIAALCVPKSALEHPDYEEIIPNYLKRMDMVVNEDSAIAERQFEGMKNPLTRPGRYSSYEKLVHLFDNWVLDQVFGPEAVAARAAAE